MQQTTASANNAPVNSVNISQPCCSIWDKLGVKGIGKAFKGVFGPLFRTQLFQFIGGGIISPVAGAVGLTPAVGSPEFAKAAGVGPAGADGVPGFGPPGAPGLPPPPPTPAELAGKIAADQKTVKFKVRAIRQLAKADPAQYPEIVDALLLSLDDPSEEVRFEALLALRKVCGGGLCPVGHKHNHLFKGQECYIFDPNGCAGCHCQEKVLVRLIQLLEERVNGCLKEKSPRIRQLAAAMIEECLIKLPADRFAPPAPQPDPPAVPVPDPLAPPPAPVPPGPESSPLQPVPPAPSENEILPPPPPVTPASATMESTDNQPTRIATVEHERARVLSVQANPSPPPIVAIQQERQAAAHIQVETKVMKEQLVPSPQPSLGKWFVGALATLSAKARTEAVQAPPFGNHDPQRPMPGLLPQLWRKWQKRSNAARSSVPDPPKPSLYPHDSIPFPELDPPAVDFATEERPNNHANATQPNARSGNPAAVVTVQNRGPVSNAIASVAKSTSRITAVRGAGQ